MDQQGVHWVVVESDDRTGSYDIPYLSDIFQHRLSEVSSNLAPEAIEH